MIQLEEGPALGAWRVSFELGKLGAVLTQTLCVLRVNLQFKASDSLFDGVDFGFDNVQKGRIRGLLG